MHYSRTLFHKPKALVNSTSFIQMDVALKDLYYKYFDKNDKDFVKLIDLVGKYGISAVENAINNLKELCPTNVSVDKIEFICSKKDDPKIIYIKDRNDETINNSKKMLSDYNNWL